MCIRGSRVKWRSAVHMDDGAGLPTSAYEYNVCAIMYLHACAIYSFVFYLYIYIYYFYF